MKYAIRSAAVTSVTAALMIPAVHASAVPSGPPPHSPGSYRLWKTVVHEPGRVCMTARFAQPVYDVLSVANSPDLMQQEVTRMVTSRGIVFTLCLRFTRADEPGTWSVPGVFATPVGRKRDPYAGPLLTAVSEVQVRS